MVCRVLGGRTLGRYLPEANISIRGSDPRRGQLFSAPVRGCGNPSPQPPPRNGEGEKDNTPSGSPSPLRGGGWGEGFCQNSICRSAYAPATSGTTAAAVPMAMPN